MLSFTILYTQKTKGKQKKEKFLLLSKKLHLSLLKIETPIALHLRL